MKQTGSVKSEGAELIYDTQGAGAPLILIPGAGGNSSVYTGLAEILAGEYTVITYDRRCNGRSSGDPEVALDMAQQARDVLAVLQDAKHDRALVFGNSGGANIALKVASDHADRVSFLVVHEPPVISLLPDAPEMIAFMNQVRETFVEQGVPAAMQLFARHMVGFSGPVAGGLGDRKDLVHFFGKEYLNLTSFIPELARIREARIPVAVLVGALSDGAYYARTGTVVAERLGCPCVSVPGNHLAFLLEPEPFAFALRDILSRLQAS